MRRPIHLIDVGVLPLPLAAAFEYGLDASLLTGVGLDPLLLSNNPNASGSECNHAIPVVLLLMTDLRGAAFAQRFSISLHSALPRASAHACMRWGSG